MFSGNGGGPVWPDGVFGNGMSFRISRQEVGRTATQVRDSGILSNEAIAVRKSDGIGKETTYPRTHSPPCSASNKKTRSPGYTLTKFWEICLASSLDLSKFLSGKNDSITLP